MHDTSTFTRIRKHVMKQVGAAKRKPRGRNSTKVELFWLPTACENAETKTGIQAIPLDHEEEDSAEVRSRRMVRDKALYDACIRSLAGTPDPFDTAAIPLDSTASELLQYFISHATRQPNTWTYSPSPLLPYLPSDRQQSVYRTIQAALQDTLLAVCLLATAAARFYYVDGTAPTRVKRKELHLTQQGLHLLRIRLQEASAQSDTIETLIACMLHLGSAAFYKSDTPTAKLHIHAAVTLAERIGGVSVIRDPYVRGRIISFDDLISCLELTSCQLADDYDPGPSSPTLSSAVPPPRDDALRNKDLFRRNSAVLPPDLQLLALQIIGYQQARVELSYSPRTKDSEASANRQWLTLRLLAIRNRLLAISPNDRRANILRVALLMWTLLPLHDMKQATMMNAMAPKLWELLEELTLQAWTGCEELHLWCLIMGFCGAEPIGPPQYWFVEEIRLRLRHPAINIYVDDDLLEALVAFQKRFLFHDVVQEPLTRHLVDCLLQASWL